MIFYDRKLHNLGTKNYTELKTTSILIDNNNFANLIGDSIEFASWVINRNAYEIVQYSAVVSKVDYESYKNKNLVEIFVTNISAKSHHAVKITTNVSYQPILGKPNYMKYCNQVGWKRSKEADKLFESYQYGLQLKLVHPFSEIERW